MTGFWGIAALCLAGAPLGAVGQSDAAAGNAHPEHEQHAVESNGAQSPESSSAMPAECRMSDMRDMRAQGGAMQERMSGVEARLESIERLLEEMLNRESGRRTRDRGR